MLIDGWLLADGVERGETPPRPDCIPSPGQGGVSPSAMSLFLRCVLVLGGIDGVEGDLPAPAGQVVADGPEVREEFLLQLAGPLRVGIDQVFRLARIIVEVVQLAAAVLEGVDQLPAVRRD